MRLTEDVRREKLLKRIPLFIAVGMLIGIIIICKLPSLKPSPPKPVDITEKVKPGKYERIVSLAPSITEILYALNCGDKVAGVTQFCKFPPEAALKPKVGGLLDTNFESIYALDPDLVIILSTDVTQKPQFDKMSLPTLEVGSNSIEEILDGIRLIGITLKKKNEAQDLIDEIHKKIKVIQLKTQDLPKPKVLIVFWRAVGEGSVREAYIAGSDKFHHQLIEYAGGQNAYQASHAVISPLVSAEGILKMDPDFIIEVMSADEMSGFSNEEVIKDWSNLSVLKAYKNKHIFILNKSYMGIPGPRFVNAIEDIAQTIHPEIKW